MTGAVFQALVGSFVYSRDRYGLVIPPTNSGIYVNCGPLYPSEPTRLGTHSYLWPPRDEDEVAACD